jgi:uncharacterized protein YjbI with pentapeptide repeats
MDAALDRYLDRMTGLLIDGTLMGSEPYSELRKVTASRTITALKSLDGPRKAVVIRFLSDARLINSDEPILHLSGADLHDADLHDADLPNISLDHVDLSHANLHGASLSSARMHGANLRLADLSGASFYDSTLSEADLTGADLSNSTLWNTYLRGASLVGANLQHASMSGVSLQGANISDADLTGAELNTADFQDAKRNEATRIDPKWALVMEVVSRGAEGKSLDGVDLSYARMPRARLRRASLKSANLTEAILSGADLSEAVLVGADLTRADLTRARLIATDLGRADLTHADFSGADISGANLETSILDWTDLRGVTVDARTRLLPKTLRIVEIHSKHDKPLDLRHADLSRARLLYADLEKSDLLAANLNEAILSRVNLSNASLRYASLAGTNIDDSNLEAADFTDSNVELFQICTSTNRFEGAVLPDGTFAGRGERLMAHYDWMRSMGQVEGMQPAGFHQVLSSWIPANLYPGEGEPEDLYPAPEPFYGLRDASRFPSGLFVAYDSFIVGSPDELREYAAWFHSEMQTYIDAHTAELVDPRNEVLIVLAFGMPGDVPDHLERDYLQLFRLDTLLTRVVGVLFPEGPQLKELFRTELHPQGPIG